MASHRIGQDQIAFALVGLWMNGVLCGLGSTSVPQEIR